MSTTPITHIPGDSTQGPALYYLTDNGVLSPVVATAGIAEDGGIGLVHTTSAGHMAVAVHEPILPFSSVHTEKLTPVFQTDGVYGVNGFTTIATTGLSVGVGTGSGSVSTSGNLLVASTGTTQFSFASILSRRRLRYRAGQGVVGRFTGLWSTPVANSSVVAGFGTPESTVAFGYNGTQFGILSSTGGVRELHTLTITTASTSTSNYNVTLPNGQVVNVTATNNASTTQTAYEISSGTYPGWKASSRGAQVNFLADSAGNQSGNFSLAQTGAGIPAAGTDVETTPGVAATDTWVYQSDWNGDPLDGTGLTGFTLDPTKGNVFQIGVHYGFGAISFSVETYPPSGNERVHGNATLTLAHTLKYPNTTSIVNLTQPSFPFLATAHSAGSISNVSISVASFSGFVEGSELNLGPRVSYDSASTVTSTTSSYTPIFTVRNGFTFRERANQTVVKLIDVGGSAKGNTNAQTKFYLVRDAALTGPVNFVSSGSNSSSFVDFGATGMAAPTRDQLIWSLPVIEAGNIDHTFSDDQNTLQPGESITLCVRSIAATADCTGTLNTREDQ